MIRMGKIYKDDIGVLVRADTGVDVSGAASMEFRVLKPGDTTETTWIAEEDSTEGYIKYVTVEGDLDEIGLYKIQAWVYFTAASIHRGETFLLQVYEHFE